MKGRRSTGPKRGIRSQPNKKRAGEWQIVVIDQAPLRNKAASECKRAISNLEKARAEWNRFEKEDCPAFDRWMAATFGALLTERRENEAKIREKAMLISEIDFEMLVSGVRNPRVAYAAVMERKNNPKASNGASSKRSEDAEHSSSKEGNDPFFGDPFHEFDSDGDVDEIDDFELEMMFQDFVRVVMGTDPSKMAEDRYQEMLEQFKENFRQEQQAHRSSSGAEQASRFASAERHGPAEASARIKEIYRILVRRLHPDLRADGDKEVSALWHEVQEAYERGNLERMEMLLALTDVQANTIGDQTTLSQMNAVIAELTRAYNALRKSLRQAKKHGAWNFVRSKSRDKLFKKIEREIKADIESQNRALQEFTAILNVWSQPPPKPKAKRSAARPKAERRS